MNKIVLNEINQMKFLFGYKPGKVLSEQASVEEIHMDEDSDFMDFEDIEMMPSPDVAEPGVKPDVKPGVDKPRTRPSRPDYDPANIPSPDVDPHPQGSEEDEVSYELELDDMPRPRKMRDMDMSRPRRMRDTDTPRPRRMRDTDMAENMYEIEIDSDISELFN
jgi:hypothetical protein